MTRRELDEIRRVRGRKGAPEPNAIDIILNVPADGLRARLKRNFVISSSCGVCGKTSIDSILRRVAPASDSARVAPAALLATARRNCALASTYSPRPEAFTAPRSFHWTVRCS